jgi:hypothetical protein
MRDHKLYVNRRYFLAGAACVGALSSVGMAATARAGCTTSTSTAAGATLAFPGAVGFGRQSVGGRGGAVIKVTNLNASGPGSLRAAIEASGPRIVVFEVGGVISIPESNGYLIVANPNITIAGETAPSPGIHIAGRGIKIATNNVIVRHITVRLNESAGTSQYIHGDVGFWITTTYPSIPVHDVILDHCTAQYCSYLGGAFGPTSIAYPDRITIMNCLFAETCDGVGMFLGTRATNVTMYRNVMAYGPDRLPFMNPTQGGQSVSVEYINNFSFNGAYGKESTILGSLAQYDANYPSPAPIYASLINNRCPATVDMYPLIWFNSGAGNWGSKVFHSGNYGGAKRVIYKNENTYNPLVATPPVFSGIGTTHGPSIAAADKSFEDDLLRTVGARPNDRDPATTRAINRIIARTGTPLGTASLYGGVPILARSVQPYQVPANPTATGSSGYTVIEEDLHVRAAQFLT